MTDFNKLDSLNKNLSKMILDFDFIDNNQAKQGDLFYNNES